MGRPLELSLDIAMNNLGWVFFDGGVPVRCGVIRPAIPKELLCLKGSKKLSVREQNVILVEQLVNELDSIIAGGRPVLVTGEATPGGAKDATAAVKMNMALTAAVAVCMLHHVPYRWCTPNEVKKATAGRSDAPKEHVMDWAIRRYGGLKEVKEVLIRKGVRAGKVDRRLMYEFLGEWLPGGVFEHIADACGAYEAVKLQVPGKTGTKGFHNKPRRLGK